MNKQELQEKLEELEEKREELEEKIKWFELDPDDYRDQYNDMLDEFGPVEIGNLTFYPSKIVEELDPTAYRCGLNDYVDSRDISEDEEFQKMKEELEELEDEISDIESEIEELEEEE